MTDEELIDKMVQRLGNELKGLLSKVQAGQFLAATVKSTIRQRLWHVGGQAMGVILKALDKQLASNRSLYDHRTRTVISLFGPLDLTRCRCRGNAGWSYRKYLKGGRSDLVIGAIERGWSQRGGRLSAKEGKTVGLNLAYFQRNQFRMRYGRFRQMKLPISTGAVEGACKFVVQSRCKRPGSRWSPEGLSSMLALKLMRLNDRWELLWPHLDAA